MRDKAAAPDSTRLTLAAIAAVTLLTYAAALTTGFTADDFFILARTKAANGLQHAGSYFRAGFFEYYRPVAFVSHALDWTVWGAEPFGYHLTNVLLHTGSTLLVWVLGRRLLDGAAPVVAALLFALHPASHEAVYWIAARFDLLATFFTLLALWCLSGRTMGGRIAGWAAFGLALLSKESAISLLIIAPAWDVVVERRDWRTTARRLVPLLAVAAACLVVRSLGTDVAATGGSRRLGKMILLALALGGVLAAAWWRDRSSTGPASSTVVERGTPGGVAFFAFIVLAGLFGVAMGAVLWLPATSAQAAEKLGFVAYVAFYSLTPLVTPSPSPLWFSPSSPLDALPGLIALTLAGSALAVWRREIASRPHVLFLLVLVGAALLPVSSMVGGLRYLYLSSAGIALLGGWLIQGLAGGARRVGWLALVAVLVISALQIAAVGRTWRWAAAMTRDGITLMSDAAQPCGTRDVVLLTTPAGIGGVYGNVYYEAFDVLTGCSPRDVRTLLRVVRTDADVTVTSPAPGVVDIRILRYAGNVLASADLRNFDHRIEPGSAASISTAAGQLTTFPEGTSQVFRLEMTPEVSSAAQFYYSHGSIRPAPRR
jgi:4-amino-4-deoxy-L-arabinose transferase-like glycosyltransferase